MIRIYCAGFIDWIYSNKDGNSCPLVLRPHSNAKHLHGLYSVIVGVTRMLGERWSQWALDLGKYLVYVSND